MAVDPELLPTPADVAALMPDRADETTHTFTSTTLPTASMVENIIVTVAEAYDPELALDAPDENKARYRSIIIFKAAILTELTYFSDQGTVNTDRILAWERMIDSLVEGIAAAAAAATGDNVATWVMK